MTVSGIKIDLKDVKKYINDSSFVCLSVDIGSVNLCLYIEIFDKGELKKIELPIQKKRYKGDWTPNDEMLDIIKNVCLNGKEVLLEKIDIKEPKEKKKKNDTETKEKKGRAKESDDLPKNSEWEIGRQQKMFKNCSTYLKSRSEYISLCNGIAIEAQLKTNPMAQRIAQHCYTHFVENHPEIPIVLFPSSHKTKVLGMKKYEKGMKAYHKKKQRKEWSSQKALEILEERYRVERSEAKRPGVERPEACRPESTKKTKKKEEISTGDFYKMALLSKKTDDYADTINQLQALKILCFCS